MERGRKRKEAALSCLAILSVLVAVSHAKAIVSPSNVPNALYPSWAHSHWVWLASGQANQSSEIALVNGYLDRNVPVGGVDIDSQWATGDNDFIWNTDKYPQPKQMIQTFHDLDIRVILWTTSLVDTDSPNYQYGKENNYYLNHGRTIKWWHGHGSFIDYTNPAALEWWHSQLDNVIDMGIDGWKTDGTDPYVFELIKPEGYAGHITEREYANMYYGDFFNYTRSKNPEALIMSRPVDSWEFVYWSFSPHYLMYSGWVGDQDPTFPGLQDALRNMFHSAWRNYANYGSDIGGYRSGNGESPLGRTKELFIRWAQLGAFCPLMENGGDNEHRPWMFDNNNQTLNIYRQFVFFHYELVPYFLNAGSTAIEKGVSVMYPQANQTDLEPDSWDYMLWKDILVSPIVENSTMRTVHFPSGNSWIDWFNTSRIFQGGSTVNFTVPLERFPVFIRDGAMLALNVTSSHGTGWGDELSKGFLTLFIPRPSLQGGHQIVRDYHAPSQEFWYSLKTVDRSSEGRPSFSVMNFKASAHPSNKVLFHVRNLPSFSSVSLIDLRSDLVVAISHSRPSPSAREDAWWIDEQQQLWIQLSDLSRGSFLQLRFD